MKVKIIHDADKLYVVSEYLSTGPMGGRNGFNSEHEAVLAEISNGTFEVNTAYLHGDAVDLIVPGRERNLHLKTLFCTDIWDDEREKDTYKAVDYIRENYPDWEKRFPDYAFRVPKKPSFQMNKYETMWVRETKQAIWDKMDWNAATTLLAKYLTVPLADVNWRIVAETLYGFRHHCRPIQPLFPRYRWSFNSGHGDYSRDWFRKMFPEYNR